MLSVSATHACARSHTHTHTHTPRWASWRRSSARQPGSQLSWGPTVKLRSPRVRNFPLRGVAASCGFSLATALTRVPHTGHVLSLTLCDSAWQLDQRVGGELEIARSGLAQSSCGLTAKVMVLGFHLAWCPRRLSMRPHEARQGAAPAPAPHQGSWYNKSFHVDTWQHLKHFSTIPGRQGSQSYFDCPHEVGLIEVAHVALHHSAGGTEIQQRFAVFYPSLLANTLHRLSSELYASVCGVRKHIRMWCTKGGDDLPWNCFSNGLNSCVSIRST